MTTAARVTRMGPTASSPITSAQASSAAAALVTSVTGAAVVVAAAGLALIVARGSDPSIVLAVVTAAGLVAVPVVGRALVRSDRHSTIGWLLVMAGAVTVVKLVLDAYARAAFVGQAALPHPAAAEFVSSMATCGQLALAGLAPLLLTGRLPAGRWWRVCVVGTFALMAVSLVGAFSPTFSHFDQVRNPFGAAGSWDDVFGGLSLVVYLGQNVVIVSAALSVGAAIDQLPADTASSTRRALQLLHYAAWLVAVSFLSCLVLGGTGAATTAYVAEHAALLVFAVSAWVSISRFGLFDPRQVLERALRYGLLTAVVVVSYLVLVATIRRVADGVLPDVIAVAFAALLALLLRDLAQRQVARLVWGAISDPLAALDHLGGRLEAAARPRDVLAVTAQTLCETVGLAGVRVRDVHQTTLATSGAAGRDDDIWLPLTFAGNPVGALVVTPQPGDNGISARQRALLSEVTRQLGAAVQAIVTGEALVASQRRLAALRDSERNRIRTDLHDGLGPTLAGVAWGIDRARDTVERDPAAARVALEHLAVETRGVVGEVRRLVHDLIPTRLEETGLVSALTHDAEAMGASVDIAEVCWDLTIPDAVEVAAYRIGLEAATNASRHADAANLTLRLGIADGPRLVIEVEDDGRGIPSAAAAGVGLTSMRQRAENCGGTLEITRPSLGGGTIVRAVLPLIPDHRSSEAPPSPALASLHPGSAESAPVPSAQCEPALTTPARRHV